MNKRRRVAAAKHRHHIKKLKEKRRLAAALLGTETQESAKPTAVVEEPVAERPAPRHRAAIAKAERTPKEVKEKKPSKAAEKPKAAKTIKATKSAKESKEPKKIKKAVEAAETSKIQKTEKVTTSAKAKTARPTSPASVCGTSTPQAHRGDIRSRKRHAAAPKPASGTPCVLRQTARSSLTLSMALSVLSSSTKTPAADFVRRALLH